MVKINNVVKDENGYKINCSHNGMNFYYYLEYSYDIRFFEELKNLKKMFFDLEEESWRGVYNEEDILSFFDDCFIIHNTKHEEIRAKQEDEYLISTITKEDVNK
jgi:hypothetical protein